MPRRPGHGNQTIVIYLNIKSRGGRIPLSPEFRHFSSATHTNISTTNVEATHTNISTTNVEATHTNISTTSVEGMAAFRILILLIALPANSPKAPWVMVSVPTMAGIPLSPPSRML